MIAFLILSLLCLALALAVCERDILRWQAATRRAIVPIVAPAPMPYFVAAPDPHAWDNVLDLRRAA